MAIVLPKYHVLLMQHSVKTNLLVISSPEFVIALMVLKEEIAVNQPIVLQMMIVEVLPKELVM